MSIQILGHRGGDWHAFFHKKWSAESVPSLLKNYKSILADIPKEEHYNLHFTANNTIGKGPRDWLHQSIIPFDIDHIDTSRAEETARVVCEAIGVEFLKTGIICSGYGLQIYIEIEDKIQNAIFFEQNRELYKFICQRITQALKEKKLPGKVDTTGFSFRKLLRVPGTMNIKEGRADAPAYIIQGHMEGQGFNLQSASGVPHVSSTETVDLGTFKMFPPPDTEAVLEGCGYVRYCNDNQTQLSEPEWHAMTGVLGRLPNGRDIVHRYSKKYPKYSLTETDAKLQYTLKSSGPRTCQNISTFFSGCHSCPHWGKIKSPIQIRGPNYILTANTGFRQRIVDSGGNIRSGKIAYEDLAKKFSQDNLHRTIAETDSLMVYNESDGFWSEQIPKYQIAYAHERINPKPKKSETEEFCHFLRRDNLISHADWSNSTAGKLNLLNGVFDINENCLMPHSPSLFFTNRLNYKYDPTASAPKVEKFLSEITCGNDKYIESLLQFVAYALFDYKYNHHVALCLLGSGANGKSTFLESVRHVIGADNCSEIPVIKLTDPVYAFQMQNKKINLSEETASDALLNSDTFKQASAGGYIQMKRLYENAFSVRNNTKFVFASNHPPHLKDTTYGMLRRLLIVPFDAVFKGSDIKLNYSAELKSEAPGFLNMLISAYEKLINQGHFTVSDTQNDILAEISENGDSILAWLKARVEIVNIESDLKAFTEDLYADFMQFAHKMGQTRIPMLPSFGQRLSSHMPDYTSRRFSDGNRRGIRGIRLKTEPKTEEKRF